MNDQREILFLKKYKRKALWNFNTLDEFIFDKSFEALEKGEYEVNEVAMGTFCKTLAN